MKKTTKDIEKLIIRTLLNNKDSVNLQTISKSTNSNWLTALKYCKRLATIGAVKLIIVEERVVGVKLNSEAYNLIDEVFRETMEEEPLFFQEMVNDGRIVLKFADIGGEK
jgi:hypothetical protein